MKIAFGYSEQCPKVIIEFLNKADGVEIIHLPYKVTNWDFEYDLGISFLYQYKIPKSQFERGKKWINFHPGPLPEYGGRNLAYHAIMNESVYFGATIHYMNEEFDAGPIINCVRFPILPTDTAGDLVKKSHTVLQGLFFTYIPMILSGSLPDAQPPLEPNYYVKEELDNLIFIDDFGKKLIRALTVEGKYYPYIDIANEKYYIIRQKRDDYFLDK